MNKNSNTLAYAAATVTAAIFGFSFLFTKSALDALSIFQLLGFRFMAAALFLSLLRFLGLIRFSLTLSEVKELLVVALFQPVLYFIFETIGVGYTTAFEAGIIIALVPVAITVFAVVMLKESLRLSQWLFVILSVVGVGFIVFANNSLNDRGHAVGILALVAAVVAGGLYNVLSRKLSTKYSPVVITFVMMWVGAIVFNTLGIGNAVVKGDTALYLHSLLNPWVVRDIVYLGIISSVGAFFMLNYSLSRLEASKSAVFMNLTPVVSVLAGIWFRGERFYLIQCVGALLILIGIWGANRKQNAKREGKVIS